MSKAPPATISPATERIILPPELQKYETSATFQDGLKIHFRPIQLQGAARLKELFYSHSGQTIIHRYLATNRELAACVYPELFATVHPQNAMRAWWNWQTRQT